MAQGLVGSPIVPNEGRTCLRGCVRASVRAHVHACVRVCTHAGAGACSWRSVCVFTTRSLPIQLILSCSRCPLELAFGRIHLGGSWVDPRGSSRLAVDPLCWHAQSDPIKLEFCPNGSFRCAGTAHVYIILIPGEVDPPTPEAAPRRRPRAPSEF